jgi:hypothetical protein
MPLSLLSGDDVMEILTVITSTPLLQYYRVSSSVAEILQRYFV